MNEMKKFALTVALGTLFGSGMQAAGKAANGMELIKAAGHIYAAGSLLRDARNIYNGLTASPETTEVSGMVLALPKKPDPKSPAAATAGKGAASPAAAAGAGVSPAPKPVAPELTLLTVKLPKAATTPGDMTAGYLVSLAEIAMVLKKDPRTNKDFHATVLAMGEEALDIDSDNQRLHLAMHLLRNQKDLAGGNHRAHGAGNVRDDRKVALRGAADDQKSPSGAKSGAGNLTEIADL